MNKIIKEEDYINNKEKEEKEKKEEEKEKEKKKENKSDTDNEEAQNIIEALNFILNKLNLNNDDLKQELFNALVKKRIIIILITQILTKKKMLKYFEKESLIKLMTKKMM